MTTLIMLADPAGEGPLPAGFTVIGAVRWAYSFQARAKAAKLRS